jgi:hypothetical protein
MVELVTMVAHETGWTIDEIMDLCPTQLFTFSNTYARLMKEQKDEAEFVARLNSTKGNLG